MENVRGGVITKPHFQDILRADFQLKHPCNILLNIKIEQALQKTLQSYLTIPSYRRKK